MTIERPAPDRIGKSFLRTLGTMVAYGFDSEILKTDLEIAKTIGATALEIFPNWKRYPDPNMIRMIAADSGFTIWSAHGCWGGRTISADRVDLGSTDSGVRDESIIDVKRCLDWLEQAAGTCLVVHPGGLSDKHETAARREALADALTHLSQHLAGSTLILCVENMPPGVYPGSRMIDLASLLDVLNLPNLALALDTGHAHISADPAGETIAAGRRLATTHVHDNLGKKDEHLAPGEGTIHWQDWLEALNQVDYEGPIMLECIRRFRDSPESIGKAVLELLERLTGSAS